MLGQCRAGWTRRVVLVGMVLAACGPVPAPPWLRPGEAAAPPGHPAASTVLTAGTVPALTLPPGLGGARDGWYRDPRFATVRPHPSDLVRGRPAAWPTIKVEVVWTVAAGPDGPLFPVALARGPDGRLYVADGSHQRVAVFDGDGRFLAAWGSAGTDAGQFRFRSPDGCQPSDPERCGTDVGGGVAVDEQGRVYIADYGNHRVQVFDPAGRQLLGWGREGSRAGQFRRPTGIAVDRAGHVYVSDTGNQRIQVFDPAGRFLDQWGGLGAGLGGFGGAGALTVDGQGRVYVVEPSQVRVQQVDGQGRVLQAWGIDAPMDAVQQGSAIALDGRGHLYLSSAGSRVQKFSDSGQVLARWGGGGPWDVALRRPVGIAVDEDGAVYIADRDAGRVLKIQQLLPVLC